MTDNSKRRYPDRPIRVMDWGIRNQLRFLSADRLRLTGPYWDYTKPATRLDRLVELVRDPSNVFVLFAPEVRRQSRARNNLAQAARIACADVRHVEQFADRAGTPVVILVEYAARSCAGDR